MLFKVTDCGGGVNKDLLPSELAPGQWSDSLNMRFPNGFAQRRKGITEAFTTPVVALYGMGTYTTSTKRFLIEAGLARVHVDDGATQTEITRYTDGVVIGSITNVTTTATLNTTTAHGRTTGQTVSVFGAFPAAYNGTFVITVVDADTFTYTMLSDPGGSATTVGQYSYNVQANFTGDADDRVSIFSLNGVLIFNHPVDGPYYWNGDTTTRLRRLPGWPVGQVCRVMRPFKNYLIALYPTISSVAQPHTVMWSNSAEPGAIPTTWTAASTNDAGDTPQTAEASGALVDGLALGDSFILYKDDARFAMDFIGGNDVFRVYRLPGNDGLLAPGCVAATPKGHVFLTNGDIKVHNGGEAQSIAEGRVRKWFLVMMDTTYSGRSFIVPNNPFSEVWVCFPTFQETAPDAVLAWNWNDNTWGIYSTPLISCATSGLIAAGVGSGSWASYSGSSWSELSRRWVENEYSSNEQRLILGTATKIGLADTGTKDFGVSITSRLTRSAINTGDADGMKTITRVRPHIDAQPGTVLDVYVSCMKTPEADPVWSTAATFTVGTSIFANRFSKAGRHPAVKIETDDDKIWTLRTYELEMESGGRF